MKNIWQEIQSYVSAAIPMAIESFRTEEEFVLQQILKESIMTLPEPIPVYVWDVATQFRLLKLDGVGGLTYESPVALKDHKKLPWKEVGGEPFVRFAEAVKYLGALTERSGVFIFLDAHRYLGIQGDNGIMIHRMIQILCDRFKRSGQVQDESSPELGCCRRLLFLGQEIQITPDLSRLIPRIRIPLPNAEEIRQEIELQAQVYLKDWQYEDYKLPGSELTWGKIVGNAQGLTRKQIEQEIARSANDHNALGLETAEYLHGTKLRVLQEMGLEICKPPKSEVGGLQELKRWLKQRLFLFSEESPISPLRGFMATGVPGCGKSLIALTLGQMLNAPVFRLDADAIYGSLVGESERNIRRILQAMEAIAPAVLWIDEMEKLLAQSATDSVGKKVLGIILTWMEEKSAQVVVVGTCNDIEALPSELTRKGRFDEIFFVDLPTLTERVAIAHIHLNNLADMMDEDERLDLARTIASMTNGFSGAEIAELIRAAYFEARTRGEKGVVLLSDIKEELIRTVPLSRQRPEAIAAMRKQAATHRRASAPEENEAAATTGRTAARRMIRKNLEELN